MTKEKPILFSAPMVRAILAGRKTVTRRIVKPQPSEIDGVLQAGNAALLAAIFGRTPTPDDVEAMKPRCPYGAPGDRLWVRERIRLDVDSGWVYDADGSPVVINSVEASEDAAVWFATRPAKKTAYPSIHMPRWASRITLEVVSVRAERVDSITEADALLEGIQGFDLKASNGTTRLYGVDSDQAEMFTTAREAFLELFYGINERAPLGSNPWVWRIEFRRIK